MSNYRIERDSMGQIEVPSDKYWGAQTERSRNNFKIGNESSMPIEIIRAFGYLKKAAAITNQELGVLEPSKANKIIAVCDEIIAGKLDDQFPLVIWQTGSGTQTNMNVNEVISNRAHVLSGNTLGNGTPEIHPNDHVNKSQSSNDTFPTAMHLAAYWTISTKTIPALTELKNALKDKSHAFTNIVKIGRTHFMDATPLTLGQEFSGYVSQLDHGIKALENTLSHLLELAIGGTAVGTGINAPENYAELTASKIAELTNMPFKSADNKFEALAAHDAFVESHGALKQIAISLTKIANDLRFMASGPRSGISEIILPANEPGSSIMPGKVNPTQIESITMVCAQIIGNDATISFANAHSHFQLNVYKPVIVANFLQSAKLLADSCLSFTKNCIEGIIPNEKKIKQHVNNSLMLVTALNPVIGYDKAAQIAKKAYEENISLKESAKLLGYLSEDDFDKYVIPENMVKCCKK